VWGALVEIMEMKRVKLLNKPEECLAEGGREIEIIASGGGKRIKVVSESPTGGAISVRVRAWRVPRERGKGERGLQQRRNCFNKQERKM